MNIPSLPTDNLYKFCAIAGVVLFIFGATYPLQKSMELQLKLIDNLTQTDVIQKQIGFLQADAERQGRIVNRVKSDADSLAQEKHPSKAELAAVSDENNIASGKTDKLVQATRDLQIRHVRVKGEIKKADVLLRHLVFVSIICAFSLISGAVLLLFGFRRWYLLVQLPQDRENAAKTNGADS